MNIKEFSDRTGFYPSFELYTVIEAHYMEQSGDKDAFCKAYKENTDGLAEKIQQEAAMLALNNQSRMIAAANELRVENETLKKQAERLIAQLEREQEWKPYGHNSSMKDDDYAKLCQSGRTMTDDEQIRKERNDQKRALVHKIMKEAQAKYDRYWNDYQTCGGASQLRTARKYEDLVTCCELALKELDEGCENCLRRARNGRAMADQLRQRRDRGGESMITMDEAIALVEAASSIF